MSEPVYTLAGIVRAGRENYEDFSGPIDLILHLLSKHRIEIRDIQIAVLLEQYLSFLEEMKRIDLEVASEFITMASHLVYLKSRMLLSLSDEETNAEIDQFLQAIEQRRLEEDYRRILFGRDFLSDRAQALGQMFTRPAERLERTPAHTRPHPTGDLTAALLEMAGRFKRRGPPPPEVFADIVGRETHSLGDMITLVARRLKRLGRVSLSRLLRFAVSRAERVTVFLAVLELCRNRKVALRDREEGGNDYDLEAV